MIPDVAKMVKYSAIKLFLAGREEQRLMGVNLFTLASYIILKPSSWMAPLLIS